MNIGDIGNAMCEMNRAYGWDYIYRQMAEECAELCQAALKYVRAVKEETPTSIDRAADNYIEELADVWLMIAIARTDMEPEEKAAFDRTVAFKLNRLFERLEGKKRESPGRCCAVPPVDKGSKPKADVCGCANLAKRMEDDLK